METKLEKLVKKFEVAHNKPFLYNGMPLMVTISEYWDNRRMEKENEKEVRVSFLKYASGYENLSVMKS